MRSEAMSDEQPDKFAMQYKAMGFFWLPDINNREKAVSNLRFKPTFIPRVV
jgi:hypothetical protein